MAYHDDLIEHANYLLGRNLSDDPKQVELRRAVSAAYYALFHLLTTEAAQNWKHEGQRIRFARILIARNLKLVADSFVTLQQVRNTADYDNSKVWSDTEVAEAIVQAREAMTAWMAIREKEMAQEYLFDLMGTRS